MPDTPVESVERRDSPAGELKMHLSMVNKGLEGTCLVGYADYPDSFRNISADTVLDAGAMGGVSHSGSTLVSKKRITLQGYPGMEVVMQPPEKDIPGGGLAITRIYWVAPRIYITLAGGRNSSSNDAMMAKFHDSFKLRKR
jgi:hypothetical protein